MDAWSISIESIAIIFSELLDSILYFGVSVIISLVLYLGDIAYLAWNVGVVLEALEKLASHPYSHDGCELCAVLAGVPAVGVVIGGDDDEGLVFVLEVEIVCIT